MLVAAEKQLKNNVSKNMEVNILKLLITWNCLDVSLLKTVSSNQQYNYYFINFKVSVRDNLIM